MAILHLSMPIGRFLLTHAGNAFRNIDDAVSPSQWFYCAQQQFGVCTQHRVKFNRLAGSPLPATETSGAQHFLKRSRNVCSSPTIYTDGAMAAIQVIRINVDCDDSSVLIACNQAGV
ncbi:hypothetical protein BX257_6042 [Streptomyces sp. 3212.3]|nr:hypothetical protein BX257_6042 [Streptomyces sp. 3212.3]